MADPEDKAGEYRVIRRRQVYGEMELFVLDTSELVAEDKGVIPEGTHVVRFYRMATGKRIPGICVFGSIAAKSEPGTWIVTPLTRIPGPFCSCRSMLPNMPKPELIRPVTQTWLLNVPSFPADEWEMCSVPSNSRFRVYSWCPSRKEGACFDDSFNLIKRDDLEFWEKTILYHLQGLAGFYAVLMAGDRCVGVWNYVCSNWMGPPYDRRIAKHIDVAFANRVHPHLCTVPDITTLQELAAETPGVTMIIRHLYEIGHYINTI